MTMKKTTAFLAFAGTCALAVTGPAALAAPPSLADAHPATGATASSLPVGDVDTALTSKSGQTSQPDQVTPTAEQNPAAIVGIIVQLQEGSDRAASLASINEAVASAFPGESAHVQREYDKALQGFALSAPAGSLDAIRAASGVKAAFLERETRVSDVDEVDAEGGTQAPRLSTQHPDNLSAQIMMRADQLTQKGEGKVVAVIDTGVEMTHPAFAGALSGKPSMSADDVAALAPQLGDGKTGVYVNDKFPFAYDYADGDNDAMPAKGSYGSHGTHVAGITAGNADQIIGVAPEAQIIVAKVSRSSDGEIPDSALLASLDDMVVLHPDVVNLSLGQLGGMDNEADSVYATVFKKLQDEGVSVNAAAGNHYSTGYGNTSGRNLPYASDPDSSTQCEPATYSSVLAVASVDNLLSYNAFSAAGKDIAYQRARGANGEKVAEIAELAAGSYEYVDAGFATEEDAAALTAKYPDGLAGKFALVSRGKLTFQKKIENLAALKPAGILVYNNVAGDSLMLMSVTTLDVPAAFISQENGQAMLAAADHHLTLVDGKTITPNSNYSMSDFSSWGVSPDLRLKPEVSAPGGSIYSAVLDGNYDHLSGTSMATPQMAGVSAVVLQRVQSDPLFASMSAREKVDVVQNLIMGTARPIADAAQETGVFYSPRKQGSGIVDALAATTSSVYPTVVGAPEQSRPKADLGDGTTGWHFEVTLHNLSGTDASYSLSSQALSEDVDGGYFTGSSTDWRGKGVDISYSGKTVSGTGEGATVIVPANGEATIGVDVTPGDQFTAFAAANTPNGTFLDGFVRFTSRTESQPDLTVPYLGFYGDWGKPAIFDQLNSDGWGHTLPSGIYNGTSGNILGYNPFTKTSDRTGLPKADRYVVSRSEASGAPTILEPRTGTLRSVHTLNTTYTNASGEKVASFTRYQNWKSGISPSTGRMTWVEEGHEPTSLDLRSDAFKGLPDGAYKLTLSAHNDGPSQVEQSISYDFRIDTVAPVVSNLEYKGEGADMVVSFDVSDSSPLAGIDVHDPADGLWFYRYVFSDREGNRGADGTYTYHVEVPFKDIDAAWGYQGGSGSVIAHPYLLAWDYGLNHSEAATLDLPSDNPGATEACASTDGGNWVKDGAGWWYACAGGKGCLANGWFTIDGSEYLFGPSGYMATGFLKRADGQWVYANESGALVGGWVRDGGQWYYLDPATKVMKTGWVADGGSWYYLRANGAMATGWVQVDGSWYYLSNSGTMATGWIKVGGLWYYLGTDGAMLTGTQVINGRTYVFDDSGVWRG
ncbi:S8 family serine peptidase [Schaalia odontolytica]|uniref:PIII-type proteinase n=2 Tax=Schaalia odontolytica TaxID=1660 RepID=A0A2X0TZM0_9ACTO|nr:S8 family serine peptidase [Schaalia odontolytica]WMS26532.1 S8 family serine peptidase [Schaalia odontolytica]SPT55313.1 PIII-type proteinase precursor [Schaalia odontolytica]